MTYWEKRELKAAEVLMDNAIKDVEKQLSKQYKATAKRLIDQLEILYKEIEAQPQNVSINHRYIYDRYIKMIQNINKELKKLGAEEQIIIKDRLMNLYTDNATRIGKQFGLATSINQRAVEKAVLQTWIGKANFSKRIWNNQAKLATILQKGIVDCIASGRPTDELTKELMDGMHVGYSNASRLARTEVAHVYNSSTIDRYREAGVKQVRVLAAADERTCPICKEHDGKIVDINKVVYGENIPCFHSNCRCCCCAVIEK